MTGPRGTNAAAFIAARFSCSLIRTRLHGVSNTLLALPFLIKMKDLLNVIFNLSDIFLAYRVINNDNKT